MKEAFAQPKVICVSRDNPKPEQSPPQNNKQSLFVFLAHFLDQGNPAENIATLAYQVAQYKLKDNHHHSSLREMTQHALNVIDQNYYGCAKTSIPKYQKLLTEILQDSYNYPKKVTIFLKQVVSNVAKQLVH